MKLIKNLNLNSLMGYVEKQLSENRSFFVFNSNLIEDQEKNFETSKVTEFKFYYSICSPHEDLNSLVISLKGTKYGMPLPFWLIKSESWVIRIEDN